MLNSYAKIALALTQYVHSVVQIGDTFVFYAPTWMYDQISHIHSDNIRTCMAKNMYPVACISFCDLKNEMSESCVKTFCVLTHFAHTACFWGICS